MTRMVAASVLALAVVAQPALSGDAPPAAPLTEAERLLGLASVGGGGRGEGRVLR
jgi:hypothetical protein